MKSGREMGALAAFMETLVPTVPWVETQDYLFALVTIVLLPRSRFHQE